jgi:hypothetical protein
MENSEELRLTHEKAFKLKEDFLYLTQSPYPNKDGKESDWFEIIVAPYDAEMRRDFLERYLIDLPVSFDLNLLKHYPTKDFTVVARLGYKEGPTEVTLPLLEIIRQLKLPFNKEHYIG